MARYEARLLPARSRLHSAMNAEVRGSGSDGALDDAHEVVDLRDGNAIIAFVKGARAAGRLAEVLNEWNGASDAPPLGEAP